MNVFNLGTNEGILDPVLSKIRKSNWKKNQVNIGLGLVEILNLLMMLVDLFSSTCRTKEMPRDLHRTNQESKYDGKESSPRLSERCTFTPGKRKSQRSLYHSNKEHAHVLCLRTKQPEAGPHHTTAQAQTCISHHTIRQADDAGSP